MNTAEVKLQDLVSIKSDGNDIKYIVVSVGKNQFSLKSISGDAPVNVIISVYSRAAPNES